MADNHPAELDLLAYTEDELAAYEREALEGHLAACAACAEQVRLLATARDALRAAPLLELPEERRRETIASLPDRSDPWKLFRRLRRPLLVAAPVAAAAALVTVVVVSGLPSGGGGGDNDEAAEVAALEESAEDRAGDAGEAEEGASAPMAQAALGELVTSVAGPPADVVRALADEGIEAEIVDGAVVADARAADVRSALAGRAGGPVDVYVR
jgi:anti-sigma factor RsiW